MQDKHLAEFVVASHIKNHPSNVDETPVSQAQDTMQIPQDLLKKYIVYAKENVHPKLSNMDQDKIDSWPINDARRTGDGAGKVATIRKPLWSG
ncbi:DNA replication licensing factor Mcm2-like [Anopheles moucheti]|uniref:DNA replication licensing factor Mcm2-like n=1 Tax=Anopheles moucheti TaxID=186751 RepID=UPI0022F12BFB|nr:DNA replication licensing factor Mcm2-like [Anopheles moucheti]